MPAFAPGRANCPASSLHHGIAQEVVRVDAAPDRSLGGDLQDRASWSVRWMMDCHGAGRVRIPRLLFTVFYPMAGLTRLGSGGGTYLTVHLRPQVQAGTVNSALQCAYRASGRARSFFVTLLFNSYHTKGFFLFSRQALEGDVKLAQFGPVVLRSRDTHLRHFVEIAVSRRPRTPEMK